MDLKHFSEPIGRAGEVLVVRGLLTDDLRFVALGGGSEHRRPVAKGCSNNDIELMLLDRAGKPLLVERACLSSVIECSPHAARAQVLEGSVPLRAGAKEVAIRRRGVDVARLAIGASPTLALEWTHRKVKRSAKYTLAVRHSAPAADAMMKVFYAWGPNRYLLAGYGPPKGKVAVGFDDVPGGESCVILVVYTSGLRSVVARTEPFSVPPLAPQVAIVRPREGQVFAPWHPVELEAAIRDRQADRAQAPACLWTIGKRPVGTGRLVYASTLDPGNYTATLTYGNVTRTVKIHVRVPK